MSRCRCCSGRTYKRCCQPAHQGRPAASPEALMRSRYCAYALGLVDYIVATTDPGGPQWRGDDEDAWRAEIAHFCRTTRFVGLTVQHASEAGDSGVVEFVATLEQDGRRGQMREVSAFARRDGRWLYSRGSSES